MFRSAFVCEFVGLLIAPYLGVSFDPVPLYSVYLSDFSVKGLYYLHQFLVGFWCPETSGGMRCVLGVETDADYRRVDW